MNTLLRISLLTTLALSCLNCDFSTFYRSADVYETVPPELPAKLEGTTVLLFTKTNGFRHGSIEAGVERVKKIAAKNNWTVFHTENAAVFNEKDLARFSTTVWLSTSGDILTTDQKQAFTRWLKAGAGFVGIHGAGGDPKFDGQWTWFVDNIIGALFIGHIMFPQFQDANILIEDRTHPATQNLPEKWTHEEEWYSFDRNPRDAGFNILATVDESTYDPSYGTTSIAMGDDHPVVWHHCLENGRTFYTALGHQDSAYKSKEFISMIEGAIAWSARTTNSMECDPQDSIEAEMPTDNAPE